MISVVDIMNVLNGEQSPIKLRDNEAFSVPFISEHCDKKMLTLLCYKNQFRFGGTGSTKVTKIYYINPDDVYDFFEESADDPVQNEVQLKLFSQISEETIHIGVADGYKKLLDITEIIFSGAVLQKETVLEYARLISQMTNETMKAYYLYYGHDYFMWLESFI